MYNKPNEVGPAAYRALKKMEKWVHIYTHPPSTSLVLDHGKLSVFNQLHEKQTKNATIYHEIWNQKYPNTLYQ